MPNPYKGKVATEKQDALEEETLAILLKGNLDLCAAIKHYCKVKHCEFAEGDKAVKRIQNAHFKKTRDPAYPRR